ncbi:MAG TPA: hypothetical protein DCP92_07295 [Nitrospiraceae bacterium]|nr:hypothetical protein [Nitrospiraceae bacterium]
MQDHIAVLLPNEHDVKKAQFDCKTKDVMFQLLSKEGFISTVDVLLCRGLRGMAPQPDSFT